MVDRIVKMLLTGNALAHLIMYYLFKVSIKTLSNCLGYEQVNTIWLVIIDLEKKILISVSVSQFNLKLKK